MIHVKVYKGGMPARADLKNDTEKNVSLPKEQKKQLLAKFLKQKLQSANMRSNELAEKLNKRPSEISKWLKGGHNFTLETLFEIEEKLGITIVNIQEPEVIQSNVYKFGLAIDQQLILNPSNFNTTKLTNPVEKKVNRWKAISYIDHND